MHAAYRTQTVGPCSLYKVRSHMKSRTFVIPQRLHDRRRQCWLQLWVSCTIVRRCCDCTASSAPTTNVQTRLDSRKRLISHGSLPRRWRCITSVTISTGVAVAWWSVVFVTAVGPAKTAEPKAIRFGGRHADPRNHVGLLDGVQTDATSRTRLNNSACQRYGLCQITSDTCYR